MNSYVEVREDGGLDLVVENPSRDNSWDVYEIPHVAIGGVVAYDHGNVKKWTGSILNVEVRQSRRALR